MSSESFSHSQQLKSCKWYRPQYQIPKTFVDDLQVYNYKLFSKVSTCLFLITVFALPIIFDLLRIYVLNNNNYIFLFLILNLVSYGFSFGWLMAEDAKKFINSGAWAIYLFVASQTVSKILFAIFIKTSPLFYEQVGNKIELTNAGYALSSFIQSITGLVTIFIILFFSKQLASKIGNTLLYNVLLVAIVIIISLLIIFQVTTVFKFINDAIGTKKSANQTEIEKSLSIISGKIGLFIMVVITAPLLEELATRHSIFMLSRYRWLGFFISSFYFAWMHVRLAGDIQNIFSYLGFSLLLSLLFIFSRENVTYSFVIHLINNLISYTVLVAT
ncbi:type II CAAX prenyl endopeptidase Rce1 family protein [Spiroplasma endosymbiont of Lonchoptera lutea]|uniref:CPBP family glutamic-type intramembrane protease n=1 Tax=Spiroplasma endosymbiont of Lonchoptera lutea TaxID=3066297 RepID=UPI0030D4D363